MQEYRIGDKVSTGSLDYELIKIGNITGWKIKKAFGRFYRFECPRVFHGFPVISMDSAFESLDLHEIDVSGLDTGNIITASGAFKDCSNLEYIDISTFDLGNLASADHMFIRCSKLKHINLGHLNMSKVENIGSAFDKCRALKKIDMSEVDLSSIKVIANMFNRCYALEDVKLPKKKMSPSAVRGLFLFCKSLKEADLSSIDFSDITDLDQMFSGDQNLRMVNAEKICTNKVVSAFNMFLNCSNLEVIDIRNIKLAETMQVYDYRTMFKYCNRLKIIILQESKIISGIEENWDKVSVIEAPRNSNTDNMIAKARMFSGDGIIVIKIVD